MPNSDLQILLCLLNARRFYSSKGDPLGTKGLTVVYLSVSIATWVLNHFFDTYTFLCKFPQNLEISIDEKFAESLARFGTQASSAIKSLKFIFLLPSKRDNIVGILKQNHT